jgi:urease accessory protein
MEPTTAPVRRYPSFATRPEHASPIIGMKVMSTSTSLPARNATIAAPTAQAPWSSTPRAPLTTSPATTVAPSWSSGNAPSPSSIDEPAGWRAELRLRFATAADGGSGLVERSHRGPLVVQRPFYPEGRQVPHVYVLHPPGGVVGGDQLLLHVVVDRGARCLMTTPAATKIYRSPRLAASQVNQFEVGQDAGLEWLPQETILHDGARAELETTVHLAAGARFVGSDILCFGLSARGETFASGCCRQRWELWRGDLPVVIERGRFDAADPVHGAAWGLGGARVSGLLVVSPAPIGDETLARARARAAAMPLGDRAGVTVLAGGDALVCRYVGASAERARAFFQDAWAMLRPAVMGRPAIPPRVWAT